MRTLLALLLFAGPLLGQAANGWAPIENGWGEVQIPSSVSAPSGLTAGRVTLSTGAMTVGDDAGLAYSSTGTGFKLGIGTDVFLSRASAGLLLVEDGSGNARDVQARTGTFGTSLYSPLLSAATNATGTNTAGANLTIQPQAPTGNATPTLLVFKTPSVGASGTTAQTQTTRLSLSATTAQFAVRVATSSDVLLAYRSVVAIGDTSTIDGYHGLAPGYGDVADGAYVASAFILPTSTSGATLGAKWLGGNGSPEGVISATVGSLYSRFDGGAGTTLYVKESGSGKTGWVAK